MCSYPANASLHSRASGPRARWVLLEIHPDAPSVRGGGDFLISLEGALSFPSPGRRGRRGGGVLSRDAVRLCLESSPRRSVLILLRIRSRSHRHIRIAVSFEEKRLTFARRRADFVHRRGFVDASVHHDVRDLVGVTNVGQNIAVDDDEIRELPDFERADVFIHPEIARTFDGGDAEGLQRRHAAERCGPHFPMRSQSFSLTVSADVNLHAGALQFGRRLRYQYDVEVLLRRRLSTNRARP